MAFISAVPAELFSETFRKNALYRGTHQLTFRLADYAFCLGNYSEDLLKKSFAFLSDDSLIAFDTSPWACDKLLPAFFEAMRQAEDLDLDTIVKGLEGIKADYHCVLFFDNALYGFHSLVSNRPIFYSKGRRPVISNSLRSIQQALDAKISLRNLAEFLIPEYSNPTTTVWEGIARIRPGGMLTPSGSVEDFQFFRVDERVGKASPDELIRTMREKFENAVFKSLYGTNAVLLSGGIDSSSIVCTALQKTDSITGFSLVYDAQLKKCDEQKYVDAIVERYKLDVHKLAADDLVPFSRVIDDTDEPELWPYTVRNYALLDKIRSELAGAGGYINVIAGEGGDELLLGQIFSVFERFDNVSWQSGLRELLHYKNDPGEDFKRTVESEAGILSLLASGYYTTDECLAERVAFDIPGWITEDYVSEYGIRDVVKEYYPVFRAERGVTSRYSQYLFSKMAAAGQVECGGWHEDEILRFGLNAAYPFVDYELAEFVWSLPAQYLRYEAKEKWILREALKEYVPSVINERTDKTEATPMLDDGIAGHVDLLLSIDENSLVHRLGVIDCGKYREAVFTYLLGRKDLRVHLWATYTVEKWLERNAEYL